MFKHPDFTTQDGVPFHGETIWQQLKLVTDSIAVKTPLLARGLLLFLSLPAISGLLIAIALRSDSDLQVSLFVELGAGVGIFVLGLVLIPRLMVSKWLLVPIVSSVVLSVLALPWASGIYESLLLEFCVGMMLLVGLELVIENVVVEQLVAISKGRQKALGDLRKRFGEVNSLSELWLNVCKDIQSNVLDRDCADGDNSQIDSEMDIEKTTIAAEIVVYVYQELRGRSRSDSDVRDAIVRMYRPPPSAHPTPGHVTDLLASDHLMGEMTERIQKLLCEPRNVVTGQG